MSVLWPLALSSAAPEWDRSWGPETEGFKLSIRTEKAEYAAGEPIKLEILVKCTAPGGARYTTNRIEELEYPVAITIPSPDWIPFRIPAKLTEEGRRRLDRRRSRGSWGFPVEQGRKMRIEMEISSMYDMTMPGTYKVQVSKTVLKLYEKGYGTLKSNEIAVTVRDVKGHQ
jgi:hypothetical protein